MENILNWVNLIYVVGGAILALIPTIIALISSIKARVKATTAAEKEAATNDMVQQAQQLISKVEETYATVDKCLKEQGSSAGIIKKDMVLTKLKGYAVDQGYNFDEEFWSTKIDEIVELTKKVNSK